MRKKEKEKINRFALSMRKKEKEKINRFALSMRKKEKEKLKCCIFYNENKMEEWLIWFHDFCRKHINAFIDDVIIDLVEFEDIGLETDGLETDII